MKQRRKMFFRLSLVFLVLLLGVLTGCGIKKDDPAKVRDLEFSVVPQEEIPQDLLEVIREKEKSDFKLTYTDDKNLYIVTGYGEQKGGGYSIAVVSLYLTENSIVLDADLIGPEKGEDPGTQPSYPYIVIRTEMSDLPVIFQ